MSPGTKAGSFSAAYKTLASQPGNELLEEPAGLMEHELQRLWLHGAFDKGLTTVEGHALRIQSPGWWNRLTGPDFRNAQVEFNGTPCTGDVEIHRSARDWYEHGHHRDPAYNQVLLHVVRFLPDKAPPARTESGRAVATLVWPDADEAARRTGCHTDEPPERCGACATALCTQHPEAFRRFLGLAGEWRILEKMRRIQERMIRAGIEQAVYEAFMSACGYSNYKDQFSRIARTIPYDRARQLAQQEPLALEAAFLRAAGLLPDPWPHEMPPPNHFNHLRHLCEEHLHGLRALDIAWPRIASRPANAPERRLAGAARLLMRTADKGLHRRLDILWRLPMTPIRRRRALEELFGGAAGFWADHYRWHGPPSAKSSAPLGAGRIRSVIGNVFIPAALAWARHNNDRVIEENAHALFLALPKEPDNRIHRTMIAWMGAHQPLAFQHQQGLQQIHEDWCARNPSCRNCSLLGFFRALEDALGADETRKI